MIQTFTYDRSLISGQKPGEAFIMSLPIFASAESRKSGRLRPKGRLRGLSALPLYCLRFYLFPPPMPKRRQSRPTFFPTRCSTPIWRLSSPLPLAGHSTCRASSTCGIYRTTVNGSIGWPSPKSATGFATVSPAISSGPISSEGNTTSGG